MTRVFLSILWMLAGAAAAIAQIAQDDARESFLERARAGTERYRDRAAAIRDGYRLVGRDFPSMGEHWINVRLIFDGEFDPAHPEILNYAMVSGAPRLLGVGYAIPLLPGEHPPDGPAGRDAWHDHFRTLEEETARPEHHAAGSAGDRPRLAVLHAWTEVPNPAGVFAADNWAISYFRLGLAPPESTPDAAAKALSLASGAAAYFMLCIEAAVALNPVEKSAIDALLLRAETRVRAWLERRSSPNFTRPEERELEDVWAEMWAAIDASVAVETRHPLHHLPIR